MMLLFPAPRRLGPWISSCAENRFIYDPTYPIIGLIMDVLQGITGRRLFVVLPVV